MDRDSGRSAAASRGAAAINATANKAAASFFTSLIRSRRERRGTQARAEAAGMADRREGRRQALGIENFGLAARHHGVAARPCGVPPIPDKPADDRADHG